MSTNVPPTGPPAGPPPGQPTGPLPSGPPSSGVASGPPAGPPASEPPEVLEYGGGGSLPPGERRQGSGGGRRRGLFIGGVVGVLALGTAAFAAYSWYTKTGPQPAEALPADALGYVSIDLDPSGSQKIALYNTIKKFPAAEEWLDEEGIGSGDDVRRFIFEKLQAEEGVCEDVDFGEDISPWMGDRFAVAAIDRGGDTPDAVLVVQLAKADGAEEQAVKLIGECGGDADDAGFAVSGDWLIVAETDEIAEEVVNDAGEASLADDADFQKWTEAAGDAGILTAYASDGAGSFIADEMMEELSGFSGVAMKAADVESPDEDHSDPELEVMADMMEGFKGGALTVRADDGSLELELAGDMEAMGLTQLSSSDKGGDAIASLPEDTALAYGVGFESGWAQEMLDYMAEVSGGQFDVDELIEMAEQDIGLSFPEDLETVFGDSAALSIGGELDPETFFASEEALAQTPIGIKVQGDPGEIQAVLEKLEASLPDEEFAAFMESDSEGDVIAIGPSRDYREKLLENGELGDSELYQDVVPDEDASGVMFINANAFDDILAMLADGDEGLADNLEPLGALGITSWEVDGVSHGLIRVTTD